MHTAYIHQMIAVCRECRLQNLFRKKRDHHNLQALSSKFGGFLKGKNKPASSGSTVRINSHLIIILVPTRTCLEPFELLYHNSYKTFDKIVSSRLSNAMSTFFSQTESRYLLLEGGKLLGEFIQIIQVDICLSVYYLHDNFIRIAFVMCTSLGQTVS